MSTSQRQPTKKKNGAPPTAATNAKRNAKNKNGADGTSTQKSKLMEHDVNRSDENEDETNMSGDDNNENSQSDGTEPAPVVGNTGTAKQQAKNDNATATTTLNKKGNNANNKPANNSRNGASNSSNQDYHPSFSAALSTLLVIATTNLFSGIKKIKAAITPSSSSSSAGGGGVSGGGHHTAGSSSNFLVRIALWIVIAILVFEIGSEVMKLGGSGATNNAKAAPAKHHQGDGSTHQRTPPLMKNDGSVRKAVGKDSSDQGGSSDTTPPPPPPPAQTAAVVPLLEVVTKFTRQELLSAIQPFRDITLLPTVHKLYRELVRANEVNVHFNNVNKEGGGVSGGDEAFSESLSSVFPTTALPAIPWVQITSAKMVEERNIKVGQLYSCFGADDDESMKRKKKSYESDDQQRKETGEGGNLKGGFDFAFFPVGCFGDPVPKASGLGGVNCANSKSPSCRLGAVMNKMASCAKRRFGAFLGDNFYPNGITGRSDRRIEEEIPEKFTKYRLLGGGNEGGSSPSSTPVTKWYVTVGNHDLKPHYQIRTESPSWVMPDVRHASELMTADSSSSASSSASSSSPTTVQLFLFSTQWGYHHNDPFMENEAKWLDEELSKSKADWKIVGTHEQIFGFMGFEHGAGLIKYIHPVLIKHQVRLFVCAHTHSVQSFLTSGNYYQVTSAGFSEMNMHVAAKPRRPPGYYHAAAGAVAILISKHYAHVVSFDEKENIIFAHKVYREIGKGVAAVENAKKAATAGGSSSSSNNNNEGGSSSSVISPARARLLELHANGVDPRDPMWRVLTPQGGRRCDRFKLKETFENGLQWDKSDEECFMYA